MNQKYVSLLVAAGMAYSLTAGAQSVVEYNNPDTASDTFEFTGTSFYPVNGSGNIYFYEPEGDSDNFHFGGEDGMEASINAIILGQPISTSTSFEQSVNWGRTYFSGSADTEYFELNDTIGDSNYYGWCEIYYNGAQPIVEAIAMDTTPDDTNFTIGGVPEPSTLALGALGLGGLMAARRRARP